jgi:streptomycin 6-kinase
MKQRRRVANRMDGVNFAIPSGLAWLENAEGGPDWLRELPARVARCAEMWKLRLDPPYRQSQVSIVFPAIRRDGELVALKIQWPHPESEHEHEALRLWNGNGAVRLIEFDAEEHALLMERCEPGDHLSAVDAEQALEVLAEMLPRLWVPAGEPFRPLADECAQWRKSLPANWELAGRPYERALLDAALAAIDEIDEMDEMNETDESCGAQASPVLLHQDLHGDNVLRAAREPWLAIDPKPLRGPREFSLAPIIRSYEFGHSREAVLHRLDWLSASLRLDRERCRLWALLQTLAWSSEGAVVLERHVETARWLWQAG